MRRRGHNSKGKIPSLFLEEKEKKKKEKRRSFLHPFVLVQKGRGGWRPGSPVEKRKKHETSLLRPEPFEGRKFVQGQGGERRVGRPRAGKGKKEDQREGKKEKDALKLRLGQTGKDRSEGSSPL